MTEEYTYIHYHSYAIPRQALHRIFITIHMRHAGRIKARQAERARGEGL